MEKEVKKDENLSVGRPNKDELEKQLKSTLKNIDKKLKSLSVNTIEDPNKTSGHFKYNELDGNSVNINNSTDPVYLGKALAKMYRIKQEYNEVMAITLGLKEYPVCMWYGASVDNLIHDITNRLKIVVNQALVNKLTESKKKLETFLSEDEKLFSILSEIAELAKL